MVYRYMIRTTDGELLFQDADSPEQAMRLLKLPPEKVRRHMPIKCLDTVKAMSEDTKAKLRALNEKRRALRRVRPYAEGRGENGEATMSEGTLEALKEKREKAAKQPKKRAGKPTAEAAPEAQKETEEVKTNEKRKPTKKSAPKNSKRAAAKREKKNGGNGKRDGISLFDHPVSAVLRWMGKDEFSYDEAVAALKSQKVNPLPAEGTIRNGLGRGRRGVKGEPAKLTAEQQKTLRDAAKTVKDS